MGDILSDLASRRLRLMGLWGCGQRGSAVHQIHRPAGRAQRPRAEPVALRVDVTEFDIGIAHQPVAALGLDNPDRLADQRLADKDQVPRPLDLACRTHASDRDVAAIGRIFEAIRVGPRRGIPILWLREIFYDPNQNVNPSFSDPMRS